MSLARACERDVAPQQAESRSPSQALAACTLAPHYERPAAPVPDSVRRAAAAAGATPAAEIAWQEFFPDPELQDLIGRALANNRDLRIATLNVEAARAQYRIQRADLVPVDRCGRHRGQRAGARLDVADGQ